jgi:hypothetical protein
VDFQNADAKGRVRLNSVGTINDLASQQVALQPGLVVDLYAEDADEHGRLQRLVAGGVVEYSSDEQCWVAAIDWDKIRAESITSPVGVPIDSTVNSQPVLAPTRHSP